jgi:hypothetical protein
MGAKKKEGVFAKIEKGGGWTSLTLANTEGTQYEPADITQALIQLNFKEKQGTYGIGAKPQQVDIQTAVTQMIPWAVGFYAGTGDAKKGNLPLPGKPNRQVGLMPAHDQAYLTARGGKIHVIPQEQFGAGKWWIVVKGKAYIKPYAKGFIIGLKPTGEQKFAEYKLYQHEVKGKPGWFIIRSGKGTSRPAAPRAAPITEPEAKKAAIVTEPETKGEAPTTYEVAMAAGQDAANRQMRAEGRTRWNKKDQKLATKTFENVWYEETGPSWNDVILQVGGEIGALFAALAGFTHV